MSSSGDLRARLVGSIYFIPLLVMIILGHPFSVIAGWMAIGWVAYEAVSILTAGKSGWPQRLFWLAILLPFGLVFLPVPPAFMVAVGGGLWTAALLLNNRREPGFVSLMVCASASLGVLLAKENGHLVLICLAAVVSAGDVGAYVSGRLLGGPKLAPQISPSKTWSGAIGGLGSSLAVVAGLAVWLGTDVSAFSGWGFAVLVCVLAQSGDLFESGLKRRLGIKDSGSLVPGHGGALDRFDGYLAVLPVVIVADMLHYTPFWLRVTGQ